MLEALSKSVLLFLIASILVELRPTKKVGQNVLNRGSISSHICKCALLYYLLELVINILESSIDLLVAIYLPKPSRLLTLDLYQYQRERDMI